MKRSTSSHSLVVQTSTDDACLKVAKLAVFSTHTAPLVVDVDLQSPRHWSIIPHQPHVSLWASSCRGRVEKRKRREDYCFDICGMLAFMFVWI